MIDSNDSQNIIRENKKDATKLNIFFVLFLCICMLIIYLWIFKTSSCNMSDAMDNIHGGDPPF